MLQMGTEYFGARARYYVMTAMTVIVLMGRVAAFGFANKSAKLCHTRQRVRW